MDASPTVPRCSCSCAPATSAGPPSPNGGRRDPRPGPVRTVRGVQRRNPTRCRREDRQHHSPGAHRVRQPRRRPPCPPAVGDVSCPGPRLVLAMTAEHRSAVLRLAPGALRKTFLLLEARDLLTRLDPADDPIGLSVDQHVSAMAARLARARAGTPLPHPDFPSGRPHRSVASGAPQSRGGHRRCAPGPSPEACSAGGRPVRTRSDGGRVLRAARDRRPRPGRTGRCRWCSAATAAAAR